MSQPASSRTRSWLASWRMSLAMARADSVRHRLRTVLATLLVAVVVAGMVLATAYVLGEPRGRSAALRSLPTGAQAVITSVARPTSGAPIPQLPEGVNWPIVPDSKVIPAGPEVLAGALPADARLTPYWTSADLLAAGVSIDPFAAGTAAPETIMSLRLREADPALLARMLPALRSGRAPTAAGEAAVTQAVADRLRITLGSPLTIVGPPPTGWMGVAGPLDQLVGGTARTFTVVGVAEATSDLVWTSPGWLSAAVADHPQGIARAYVVDSTRTVTWAQVKQLNALQAYVVSRDVLTNDPPVSERYPVSIPLSQVATVVFGMAVSGFICLALLLFLVTPAFTVSAEQSRRTLALAAAAGATPADLRRTVRAQGLVIGVLGGLLGALIGTVGGLLANGLRRPGEDAWTTFPWWVVPVALGGSTLIGVLAATPPARWVGRHDVVAALTGATTEPADRSARWGGWLGPVLVALGIGCGWWSLRLGDPVGRSMVGPSGADQAFVLRVVAALALCYAGVLVLIPTLLGVAGRLGRGARVGSRLALGDAVQHPRRSRPAVAAVLTCLVLVTAAPVLRESAQADQRDLYLGFAAPGRLVAGPTVPVSPSFDSAAVGQAVRSLEPVVGTVTRHPLSSWDLRHPSHPVVTPVRVCPGDSTPTLESTLSTSNPLTCDNGRHSPGQTTAWMLGESAYVMDGAALRASGMPGADAAAAVLDRGGVVVTSANNLTADGHATVSRGAKDTAGGWLPDPSTSMTFEAGLVPLYGPKLVLSPAAAQRLGLTDYSYVGEILGTQRSLSAIDVIRATASVRQATTLVSVYGGTPTTEELVSNAVVALLLVGAAVAATATSLALARTQSLRDAATMEAVGATAAWVRRYSLVQSGVLLGVGLPFGVGLGLALGAYVVRFMGAWSGTLWRQVVVPWPEIALSCALVVAGSLVAAWWLGRGSVGLVRRGLD